MGEVFAHMRMVCSSPPGSIRWVFGFVPCSLPQASFSVEVIRLQLRFRGEISLLRYVEFEPVRVLSSWMKQIGGWRLTGTSSGQCSHAQFRLTELPGPLLPPSSSRRATNNLRAPSQNPNTKQKSPKAQPDITLRID